MLTSENRFLTTHAGSLPRPTRLAELHGRRSRGETVDRHELERAVEDATAQVIAAQLAAGIDVGNDGEQARESFVTYVQHRMTGFGGTGRRTEKRDLLDHPDFMELTRNRRGQVSLMAAPAAIADVVYRTTAEVDAECALVAEAPFAETFMTAASPGIVASVLENRHYGSMQEYLRAVGLALAVEYRFIVEHGLLLQIDAPDLALERHQGFADRPLAAFLEWAESVVDTLNGALAGIDPGRVRLHLCWGNYEGPHTHDVGLDDILPVVYGANVGALVVSMANPRHAHEFASFARRPLPDDMVLVAGVIDTTTNYVEHPEVVADRLVRISHAVGDPRRVIAGTDCGFDTSAGIGDIAPSVVWAKLRSLRAGADLATSRLYPPD
ncbi:MAG TPA: cobalamin-independent methionine synthase II family protein [Acidimicrobiales bacterium]|nr:cobalamin-independent methionine synthase II family protein [Acidimicrobiales bacterium]